MAYANPFVVQIGPKNAIFKGYQIFFRTTGLQQKLLKLIESSSTFHWKSRKKESRCGLRVKIWAKLGPMLWKNKETGIINGLFSNFA